MSNIKIAGIVFSGLLVLGMIAAPHIISEVARINISQASCALSVLTEGTPQFEMITQALEEAVNLRIFMSEIGLMSVSVCFSTVGIGVAYIAAANGNTAWAVGGATFAIAMIGGAVALEYLLHDVLMEEVKKGFVKNNPLVEVLMNPPLLSLALTIAAGITAAIIGGIVALVTYDSVEARNTRAVDANIQELRSHPKSTGDDNTDKLLTQRVASY